MQTLTHSARFASQSVNISGDSDRDMLAARLVSAFESLPTFTIGQKSEVRGRSRGDRAETARRPLHDRRAQSENGKSGGAGKVGADANGDGAMGKGSGECPVDDARHVDAAAGKDSLNCHVDENACAICLLSMAPGDLAVALPCAHVYHHECIEKWVRSGRTADAPCPVCKQPLLAPVVRVEGLTRGGSPLARGESTGPRAPALSYAGGAAGSALGSALGAAFGARVMPSPTRPGYAGDGSAHEVSSEMMQLGAFEAALDQARDPTMH